MIALQSTATIRQSSKYLGGAPSPLRGREFAEEDEEKIPISGSGQKNGTKTEMATAPAWLASCCGQTLEEIRRFCPLSRPDSWRENP